MNVSTYTQQTPVPKELSLINYFHIVKGTYHMETNIWLSLYLRVTQYSAVEDMNHAAYITQMLHLGIFNSNEFIDASNYICLTV